MRCVNARSVVAAALLVWSMHALGADPCAISAPPSSDTLWSLLGDEPEGCVGQYVKKESKRLEIDFLPVKDETRKTQAVPAWENVVGAVEKQCTVANGVTLQALCDALLTRAKEALSTTKDSVFSDANDFAGKSAWDLRAFPAGTLAPLAQKPGTNPAAPPVPVQNALEQACQAEGSACPETYTWGLEVVKAIEIGKAVATYYGQTFIRDLAEQVAEVDRQWDRYLFQSKPMYPWDMVATDLALKWWSDYGKTTEGLRLPPEYQLFVLHPAPGFEYVSGAEDGQQLSPTIYVEIIGFNKWKARHLTGASLMVAYADRAGIEDVRGGVLLTYASKLSFGVTHSDGETGVVLGLDLANWYTEKLKPVIDGYR